VTLSHQPKQQKTSPRAQARGDVSLLDPTTFRSQLLQWYRKNDRDLPWRKKFLTSGDPYVIWVSEIMLQQTVIKAVLSSYERFLKRFPNVGALAAASDDEVRMTCQGLGYYRRFGFMRRAAEMLVESSDSESQIQWPKTREEWRLLPGIGEYTSAAISSIAFGQPHAVVDGNVARVFCRIQNQRLPVNDPSLVSQHRDLAAELLDQEQPGDYNQALMELGQLVCTPEAPKCDLCPVARQCLAKKLGTQAVAPQAKIKVQTTKDITLHLIIPVSANRVGIQRRDDRSQFLKGTEGFLSEDPKSQDLFVGSFRHTITHHRIRAQVHIRPNATSKTKRLRWIPSAKIRQELTSSLDRKAWDLMSETFEHKK